MGKWRLRLTALEHTTTLMHRTKVGGEQLAVESERIQRKSRTKTRSQNGFNTWSNRVHHSFVALSLGCCVFAGLKKYFSVIGVRKYFCFSCVLCLVGILFASDLCFFHVEFDFVLYVRACIVHCWILFRILHLLVLILRIWGIIKVSDNQLLDYLSIIELDLCLHKRWGLLSYVHKFLYIMHTYRCTWCA